MNLRKPASQSKALNLLDVHLSSGQKTNYYSVRVRQTTSHGDHQSREASLIHDTVPKEREPENAKNDGGDVPKAMQLDENTSRARNWQIGSVAKLEAFHKMIMRKLQRRQELEQNVASRNAEKPFVTAR